MLGKNLFLTYREDNIYCMMYILNNNNAPNQKKNSQTYFIYINLNYGCYQVPCMLNSVYQ